MLYIYCSQTQRQIFLREVALCFLAKTCSFLLFCAILRINTTNDREVLL